MSKKQQQKSWSLQKSSSTDAKAKQGKTEAFAKKENKKKNLSKKKKEENQNHLWHPSVSHPIFQWVSSRIKGPPFLHDM